MVTKRNLINIADNSWIKRVVNMCAKHTIFILIDGVSAKTLYGLIDKGKMPYMRKYLVDRGISVKNCLTCFPANTTPAHVSHLTGTYIDRHGIPLIKYWDPQNWRYMDFTKSSLSAIKDINATISKSVKTIYEYLPGRTSSMHFVSRGATDIYANLPRSAFLYLYSKIHGWNKLHAKGIKDALKKLNSRKAPSAIVLYLPGPDAMSHRVGPFSSEYLDVVENLDECIKLLVEGDGKTLGLKSLSLFAETLMILTADHGEMKVNKGVSLETLFDKIGLKIVSRKRSWNEIVQADVLAAVSGGVAFLYFIKKKMASQKIGLEELQNYKINGQTIDIISWLRDIKGMGRIYVHESENVYHVFSGDGESRITRKMIKNQPHYNYEVISGKDPLLYAVSTDCSRIIDTEFHAREEWTQLTGETKFSNVIDQIPRIFDCKKTDGAVIVTSASNCSFKPKHKGEHDVEDKDVRTVPLIIAESNLKARTIDAAQIVDVLPTVLKLLGRKYDPQEFDGKACLI